VSSYFVRAASYYDTLLQMGRWFGFRRGYEDLPRVWMTAELQDWFRDLATVEEEVRCEIRSYPPDVTPAQVGVKIRTHPSMTVTSPAKMQKAVDALLDYGGQRLQTFRFKHRDQEWLNHNTSVVRSLLGGLLAEGRIADRQEAGRLVSEGIGVDAVLDFIGSYRFHEQLLKLRPELLKSYIEQQVQQGHLTKWNLVVLENTDAAPDDPQLDLSIGRGVRLFRRSRFPGDEDSANIGVLTSPKDRLADVMAPAGSLVGLSERQLIERRHDLIGDVGLLGIYPISKDSGPVQASNGSARVPLDAVDHFVGVGLFFPESRGSIPYRYVTAPIADAFEFPADDIDLLDLEDEAVAATQDMESADD
jgi:hypothetical protein